MNWIYDGAEVNELPKDTYGFTYLIEYEDGTYYMGKKQVYSYIKKPLTKKELALQTDKRLKSYRIEIKEANWRAYNGSCKSDEVKGLKIKKKTILEFYTDSINLTYGELEWGVKFDALRDSRFHNANLLGKFFRNKIR